MTTVGIVGGLGPESTIDYYRRIIQVWRESNPSSYPSIIIDSLDVDLGISLVTNDHPALIEYLSGSIERLARAGADFVTMAANTPHIVYDEIASRASTPMLSIVEVCADAAERKGYRRLALLGTRFTMEAPFYPEVFARRGLEVVIPAGDDRTWVHDRYVNQLL
jgi:aspartate racemase